ncbi:MAG: biopolymer transporter Tol [Planctomycetaceae bacterium]|nr:biopolymer transporter Tol [Planctomycetaceae bacterium]
MLWRSSVFAAFLSAVSVATAAEPVPKSLPLTALESQSLSTLQQVTQGLPRAGEGYFSADGKLIVYQAYPIGYPFYQIYTQPLDSNQPRLVSTGRGRTTCAYFTPDGKTILFASSHTDRTIDVTELKAREEAAQGGRRRYQWDFDPHMDLYTVNFDGTGLKKLTDAPGYDAEGSYSFDGKQIVFTSNRDGDPDLYIMDADGTNVRQLTDTPGYDGGPFFSPDAKWVIFRSDRQEKDMLQIFAISSDGKTEVQLTNNLQSVNWCPYFHPSGMYFIWSAADYSRGPASAKFHLFTMELTYPDGKLTGGEIKQITDMHRSDVLPVFSPDGKKLMWTSTRTADESSQLFIADWVRESTERKAGR